MTAILTIVFWAITYLLIVYYGIRYWSEQAAHMPFISGSLNFAWEINAFIRETGFLGFAVWTLIDIAIFTINTHNIKRVRTKALYCLLVFAEIYILWIIFNSDSIDGKFISVYLIDLFMAIEYIVVSKKLFFRGKVAIASTRLLGDMFAWFCNMRYMTVAAAVGPVVFVLNLYYLYLCIKDKGLSMFSN